MIERPTTFDLAGLRRLGALAAIVLGLGFADVANAEQANFDDAKLDAFVEAAVKVEAIKIAAVAKAQTLNNEQELQTLQQETHDALIAAVEDTDNMSVGEYNAIVNASRADDTLKQRIASKIEKKASELEQQEQQQTPEQAPPQTPEQPTPQ